MQTFKIFLLFSILTVMVGCLPNPGGGDSQNEDYCNSNFVIEEEVKGSFFISDQTALPEKFTLQLTACIRPQGLIETKLASVDWAISRSKVQLEKTIKKGDLKNINKSTNLEHHETVAQARADANGCIHWTEEYDYAYNKQSQWIILDRYIGGIVNEYSGICKIPVAVNPWLQVEKYSDFQIADYREKYERDNNVLKNRVIKKENGIAFLKRKKEEERKNKVDIIINPLQLNTDSTISAEVTQRVYPSTITARLTYTIKDITGALSSNYITQGDFVIEAILLVNERNSKKAGIVTEEFIKANVNENTPIKTRFKDKYLTSNNFQWVTPYERPHYQLKLYLKVKPTGETAKRINSFEGIYPIGNKLDTLQSNNILTLPLNNILSTKYDNKILGKSENVFSKKANPDKIALNECLKITGTDISQCLSLHKTLDASYRGTSKAGWRVGNLNIRFFQMKWENWLFREITSLVNTNIYDQSLGDIGKEPILIEILDLNSGTLETVRKKTNDTGYLSFNITSQQKWYKKQRYFLKRIRFYASSTTAEHETKELRSEKIIALNPWDYGFTHGYEVDQADYIRATCLANTTEDKTKVKNLLLKPNQDFTEDEIETIQKMFCHNPQETKYPTNLQITSLLSWDKVFNLFRNTLNPLFDPPLNVMNNPEDSFYHKFTSLDTVKIPESYVHLFRSINVYPTPLIDSSLIREVYYNTRFKFTPRVVRHDDVPRGQQNKGPLRDGVYIFQMAVLKNDQGRFNGRTAMVQPRRQFDSNVYKDSDPASTRSLFSCPIKKPNCVEIEDFIIPPQNIPFIIRDGIIKIDIPIHIKSENLLFANSKNIMVFRIQPADPKSIVCKKGISPDCTLSTGGNKAIYSSAFDWNETIKKIKPANPHDYDMFFHTYKTPFIPAAWGNWNITHELNITFDDIAEKYKMLEAHKILNEKLKSWKNKIRYSKEEYNKRKLKVASTENSFKLPPHDFYSKELIIDNESSFDFWHTIDKHKDLMEQHADETKRKEAEDQITKVANNIKEKLQESRTKTEQDDKLTEEQKKLVLGKIEELLKEIKETQSLASSLLVSTKITKLEEGTESTAVDPDTIPINQPPKSSTNEACINSIDYDNATQNKTKQKNCLAKLEQEEDLSDKHISYFASQNNLCTMHINSDFPLTQTNCGQFSTPEDAQQSFVNDLNKQIKLINNKRKTTREMYQRRRKYHYQRSTQKEEKPLEMEEMFQREHHNSRVVANKIKNLSELPFLDADALEEIIKSDINDNTIRDQKTGSFLHALCGFWFESFFSNRYTNEELLQEGLRNAVKQSFYYKIRGISKLHHERDNILMQNFIASVEEMKKNYDEYLSDQNLKGNIDDLHKWADNEQGYGFDSPFDQKLRDRFQSISNETPLSGTKPSWVDKDENTPQHTFKTQDYLDEAIYAAKRIRTRFDHTLIRKRDNHPYRKCIMNPSHFFGMEKKTIIGKVSNSMKYGPADGGGGEITTLNVSEAFLMNTQRDQGANQQFELGSTLVALSLPLLAYSLFGGLFPAVGKLAHLGRDAIKGPVVLGSRIRGIFKSNGNSILPVATGTVLALEGIKGGYSYRTYEGAGKRRWLSVQVIETVALNSEHSRFQIGLKNYHECLVIRPRFSAFESHTDKYDHIWEEKNQVLRSIYEKTGILLCTQGKEPNRYILEDYYYIYPNYSINGITVDPKSQRNKPFTISLRGTKEYQRFLHNLSCHVSETTEPTKKKMDCRDTRGKYENLFLKNIEFANNLRKGFDTPKMFHLTSDLPGVHSPYKEPEDRKPRVNTRAVHKIINWFSEFQFMDMDLEKVVRKEEPVD